MGRHTEPDCINSNGKDLAFQETATQTLMTKEEIISALNSTIDELIHAKANGHRVDLDSLIRAFQALRDFVNQEHISVTITKAKRPGAERPKDWGELWNYVVKDLGMTDDDARYLWNNWKANGFSRSGKPILDWKAAARAWKAGKFYPSQKAK